MEVHYHISKGKNFKCPYPIYYVYFENTTTLLIITVPPWVKSCFKLSYVILINTMNNILIKFATLEINQRHAVNLNGFPGQDVLNICDQKDLGGKD